LQHRQIGFVRLPVSLAITSFCEFKKFSLAMKTFDAMISTWLKTLGELDGRMTRFGRCCQNAVIVSGLRRVGKSTLLAQLAHRLGQEHFYYVNFEDDRFLGFQADDATDLIAALVELFGERPSYILDEIQKVPEWERFVRRLMELGAKFYITGSNAALLSRELGTRLTGRYVPVELFPFSFAEFLRFRGYPAPDLARLTTIDAARLQQQLDEYLLAGGIPEPLKYPEMALRRTLYDDVLYRDIATRYRIADVCALRELAYFLMSNPAATVSYNKLKKQFGLGSVNTIKSYIEYLENSWLIFTVNVYDYSVKRQQIAPKKVYVIDTGLANTVGFTFSPNRGRLLENLVFLALRRQSRAIYYYRAPDDTEVDFFLPETRQLLQVTQSLAAPAVRQREVRPHHGDADAGSGSRPDLDRCQRRSDHAGWHDHRNPRRGSVAAGAEGMMPCDPLVDAVQCLASNLILTQHTAAAARPACMATPRITTISWRCWRGGRCGIGLNKVGSGVLDASNHAGVFAVRSSTACQKSSCDKPCPALILARDRSSRWRKRGECDSSRVSRSLSSAGATSTATALPLRVITTGPCVSHSSINALSCALTSAKGAIFIVQIPLQRNITVRAF
jgi:predicted AAA+ superfamily ATPase